MNKEILLEILRKGLSELPQNDIEDRITFYREMIEDRMEEGLSEEEAVLAVGNPEQIIAQILTDKPQKKVEPTTRPPKQRSKPLLIVLLAIGSPIWISLLLAVFSVLFSLWSVLMALVMCAWAIFGSLIFTGPGFIISAILGLASGIHVYSALAQIGAGITCTGLGFLMFFGSKMLTKAFLLLTKKIILQIRNRFIKKEIAL